MKILSTSLKTSSFKYKVFLLLSFPTFLRFDARFNASSIKSVCLVCRLAQELLAIEGTFSTEERRKHYDKLNFDQPLEFDEFDVGPSGGIQVHTLCHHAHKLSAVQVDTLCRNVIS